MVLNENNYILCMTQLTFQCVVNIFCIDLSSSDMFTGSFTTPREETVFGSVKSACCLFADEEGNQEKDS